uniref:Dynein axonemal heavy chain 11 n=1 Tax=Lates calcarifer TaxID=8187 RepID=A0A4W6EXC9_LATCA
KTSPPWKTKLLCVLKKGVKRIARQGFRLQLRLGEVPGYPMEHLPIVLVCVLSNGLNHEDWPRVVSDDIHRHLEKLRSRVVTLRGRAEGRTLLPLPLCVEQARPQDILTLFCSDLNPTGWPLDRGLLYSIETLIVQWSGQIWNVLKKDSGMVLLRGDHPGPNVELQFWATQRENLLGIQSQIQSPKVEQIMEILRRVKSSYYSSFKDVCLKVNDAVLEAEDIDLYLRPLRRLISSLEERSFPQVDALLPPLFHTLCLIWSHSQYYCTPQRMVVLLQEFCNLIIEKAFAYLIPEELFKMELEEGVERVQITISVLRTFKQLFHTYRQRIPEYYRRSQTIKLWDFPATLVFQRSDRIMERLLMIEELFATALDFLKLEKIELGGSRGKVLSEMVFSMSEEFHDRWRALRESKYDPLDYTNDVRPSEIVAVVFDITLDFDQRLGTVLNLAFQHSKNLKSTFKLLKIFGTLLERPRIHQLFSPNYNMLLTMFNQEIDHCQFILDQHRDGLRSGCAVLGKNMPSVAGNLKWSQELRNRILTNRSNLCQPFIPSLPSRPLGSAEADDVLHKCEHVLEILDQQDEELFSEWTEGLEEICQIHLKEPLLTLDTDTGLFQVNFSPAVSTQMLQSPINILARVKIFKRKIFFLVWNQCRNVPTVILSTFNCTNHFYTQTLTLVTQWYNQLQSTILAVELGLVKDEMDATKRQLEPALQELTWAQDDLWDYIQSTRNLVKVLNIYRVQRSKANVEIIQALMGKISHRAFITRKSRASALLIFSDIDESVSKQHAFITSTGEQIHKLLQENQSLLGVTDLDSSEWRAYTDYVDRMILAGFASAVRCSLQYLMDNTDAAQRITPLFEVQLVLNSNEMTFDPPLDFSHSGNFYDIVDKMVANITNIASFIPRLANHKQLENYQVLEYQGSFASYRYLWTDDRSEFMRQFLLYGHVLSTEEAELYADYELKKNPPTLDNFKEQINLFESLYVRVSKMEDRRVFCGWLQLDIKPFKHTLMNVIKRWSWMFKEHLLNHVNQSVRELSSFVQDTAQGLSKKVSDGDYAGLVDTMGHLMAIRDRQISNEQHFKPLKSTAELLKTYGQQLPESVYTQLEELPEKWKGLRKIAFTVKHEVAPLQSNEVSVIRRKCVRFEVKQHEFREQFRTESIFKISVEEPYRLIDKTNRAVAVMEAEMKKLQDTADLFEVSFPDYKQLRQCRSDLILVKAVWDMVIFVKTSIEDWTKTPWKEINVEQMDMELRRFAKEMKMLDKEVRVWDVYMGLESTVKNLLTSLRAVNELQNSAVRERHWQQLMNTTGVRFVMGEGTTLGDLLELQLHRVEDEVKNIVDKAVKEMAIEKVLAEITQTWSVMSLSYETHTSTGTPLLKADENLIETLEDNQVQLQNILMSKYVEYFQAEVSGWQRKLMVADLVISSWMSVQRTWAHLNSIFTNSHDIRCQLANDAERFQGIHADFQNLMTEVVQNSNVVGVTNQPGFLENLETLQQRLSVCEKALAEYLETKRLTFPRFYFVSASDLLEIVSKGTQPKQVTRHLLKLFDNIADLRFKDSDRDGGGAEDEEEAVAIGMYSREGEYVPFSEPCVCEGQCWLSALENTMRCTVRKEIQEAVAAYEDKARDQWLFDYPAQVGLTGSQVWWATDVGIAFERVEEGFETALKDYNRKQITQLNSLIHMLLGDLTPGDRQKIMTVCTIDVHARDVVANLITQKVTTGQAFAWLSQLRHRWDDETRHCYVNICDAQFQFSYEYLGNTNRLVITPLTDRCYITLTQSLHLTMSGAPSGPAGTGKTETTKDLGRSLGIMVYVFNCSEQMDYKSIGNIYKGLAQTGVWGCFDEFNRISVEVLSVVAVQVKTIQDAVRNKKFHFLGEEIELKPTVGIFITLNPGYAGRAELPENLKALFRPCAMVIPDFELICEIMLVAEGFIDARLLACKFISLYTLCKELLSKQDHYDWGLRAIKSVLVVAGSLKREDRSRPEEQVLMRALRDFNLPKIVTSDVPIFLGLISDLFPQLDVPRKRDPELENAVRQSVSELRLQPEENFILKVTQLEELLAVRHSVFVVGGPGTGKSQILKTLHRTYANMKMKPVWTDINPKAVTTDELFGYLHSATREWKDGLFSSTMRELTSVGHDGPKWIVLDGDIDPMWIESLNTVMDDNKVLTLASNERISLSSSMRLLFEISHLKAATPATVSRAGILYVNPQDLGWSSYVTSWIDTRHAQSERANLTILFDKYVPYCLEQVRCNLKTITPIPENSMVQTLCSLLDCLLTEENTPADSPRELYEIYFVFACVWAFGGALFQDHLNDYRAEFSRWWSKEMRAVKFPSQGSVFDYFIDSETKKFTPWSEKMVPFELEPDVPLQTVLVHTPETICLTYFMDLLLQRGKPIMLVGTAGVGKTILVSDKVAKLKDDYMVAKVPFNYYTTSAMLQRVLEKPLEKKAGRKFAPPTAKRLIYFIDDLNMPEVDVYGTVQPHTLIRQHLDYNHWYDRQRLVLKEIHNCQYITCMNPTAGSFSINPRLQRHFSVFAVHFPSADALATIFSSILSAHFLQGGFSYGVSRSVGTLIQAAICLHQKISQNFLPTAIRFHYIFNLRDLSNIFQGILFALPECIRYPMDLVHLWLHESSRVYSDKLMEEKDVELFNKILLDTGKRYFEGIDESMFIHQPLVYCHFAHGVGEPRYHQASDWEKLQKTLADALEHYNELHAVMDLVLFEEAIQHVCRISRILEAPYGNALLVGVGGSGKQSLCRLAAFLSMLEVFQITLRKGYGINDLKVNIDIAALYIKVGVKNIGTVFLHTDAQIPDERFLVLINDMLASGDIPDLFSDEEVDTIVTSIRMELRGLGLIDTRDNCWSFFIERIRRQLKVVLCFSPVGFTLRTRARKFPALVNCTAIDWFHPWPQLALQSVSCTFIEKIPGLEPNVRASISEFISYAHTSVNEVSVKYQQNEKHFNYTTPKSFLEFMKLYDNLLGKKRTELTQKMERLENGLQKLQSTASQVEDLKAKLAVQEVELWQRNTDIEALIAKIGQQTDKLNQERAVADAEEQRVAAIQAKVTKQQQETEEDLAKAEPALQAANAALNTLNRLNLTELRTFPNPPAIVTNVSAAVLVLLAPQGRIPKDRSWKASKMVMSKVDDFLQALVNFDKEHIPEATVKCVRDEYLSDPEFNPEFVRQKSSAAAGLCAWVINIVRFHEVFCEVEMKRMCLAQANADLAEAAEKLEAIRKKLAVSLHRSLLYSTSFEKATSEKLRFQEEVNRTNKTIELANRLVKGLESENVRWAHSVAQYHEQEETLSGDVLLTAAFISYSGSFSKKYRRELLDNLWMPFLRSQKMPIPMTEGLDPVSMLTDDATVAQWNNEGLPGDKMSTQNATILTNCERWPLLIDPQLQGIKWIKSRYGSSLKVISLGQRGYVDVIEQAVVAGDTVLIENLEETIDPVIDPLLGRHTIKKGRYCIKVGDKECFFHPGFRLILHTKLANPHYKPEIQAQTTLINFTVTRDGLEDQLLAQVVNQERPDLEHLKVELTKQQNMFKIELKLLEDELLTRLSAAESNFLGDNVLVEKLETTKHTAAEIEMKVLEAKVNEVKINEAREHYRAVAVRASLLYFIMNDLNKINPMYQFSLKAFNVVFHKAVEMAEACEDVKSRVNTLIDCVTYSTFNYISRGLFERDKLTFTAQLAFQLLLMSKEIDVRELNFLLRFNIDHNYVSPLDFLSNSAWSAIKVMSFTDEFRGLDRDIEGSPKRWKKMVESECPEKEKFPQEWKGKSSLQKLIMMRALRPDRMTYALRNFVEEKLGVKYTEGRKTEFAKSFRESGPASPVFFILSPGVDPLKDVESLGRKLGFTIDLGKLHNVSLGQGQEAVAEVAMEKAAKEGHWVILQNIHLVGRWLGSLEKLLERCCEDSHPDYRVFMSAEPAPMPQEHIIPQGILENAIKITNEPPTGMHANLHAALDNFDQDILDQCSREQEFKTILFSLCYFHACVAERRKFGPQGWNRKYPFNTGDLTISVNVLYNYLEANAQVPWEDLRYLFGEIMYGGHITDDWDRRLCRTYLEEYMQPNQFDRKLALAPGFVVPSNLDYQGYHDFVDEMLPHESPVHYGLHPNAEIEFLTVTSDNLFHTLLELQSPDAVMGEGASQTLEEKVKTILDEVLEKLPEEYNMSDITSKTAERSPYILVCFQECERMNTLISEIRRSLKELDLGLKGELAISSEMEKLQTALFFDNVPDTWTKLAYPSTYSLAIWYNDVLQRCKELDSWTQDLSLPSVVWLSGLFNPQSFLTAVMQSLARKNEWPLDKVNLTVDVTKKFKEEFNQPAREGAYVYGLYMEGARWDTQAGVISEARLKELTPPMPVISVRAVPNDRQETRNIYECPLYKTKIRGPTYVWTFSLKTRERPAKWVLAGVALLLSV